MAFDDLAQKVAADIFDVGAIQFGSYAFKHHELNPTAERSPMKFELRTPDHPSGAGRLTQEVLAGIGQLLNELLIKDNIKGFNHVAGIPQAGDPITSAFMEASGNQYPRLWLSKETLPNSRRRISGVTRGDYRSGDTVLLIDDLVTQGNSKLEPIQALAAQGLEVKDLLLLVDREQGGRELLESRGCRVHVVFLISELLEFYAATGRLDRDKAAEVLDYVRRNRI